MAARDVSYHRRSCPYFIPNKEKKKGLKGWPGPVFANEMGLGWTKLNAVRACNRCRTRHVKCSLVNTGGPCTHCQKRKEVCEVLGWKLKPDEPTSKPIYKYVLPPPPGPVSSPPGMTSADSWNPDPLDAEELSQRLEQLSPRSLALLWPWGPDDRDPFYPMGPQFGYDYHEECWDHCPMRRLSHKSSRLSPASVSPSSSSSLDFSYQSSSTNSATLAAKNNTFAQTSETPSVIKNLPINTGRRTTHDAVATTDFPLPREDQSVNRMSLNFILNSKNADMPGELFPKAAIGFRPTSLWISKAVQNSNRSSS